MLYISILTSDRQLDPELWALTWQARQPPSLTLHHAYNLAGNKRLFVWEADDEAGLRFMDNALSLIGEVETYPAFDRTTGWQTAFASDLEGFEAQLTESQKNGRRTPAEASRFIADQVSLRRQAMEAPNRYAAMAVAANWKAAQADASE